MSTTVAYPSDMRRTRGMVKVRLLSIAEETEEDEEEVEQIDDSRSRLD